MNKLNEGAGTTRRRGAELEAAILQAAWAELMEIGFHNLTIEGVAARAQTSKPVIYRRWPNREELVLAAILNHLPAVSVPDTGNLRSDVLFLLHELNNMLQKIGPKTIHGLMSIVSGIPFSDILNFRRTNVMTILLNRAADRGEIRADKVTPRITRLPVDLLRHELLITLEPVSQATMEEIVDEIFLPLLK